jgi:hypothetical protein
MGLASLFISYFLHLISSYITSRVPKVPILNSATLPVRGMGGQMMSNDVKKRFRFWIELGRALAFTVCGLFNFFRI